MAKPVNEDPAQNNLPITSQTPELTKLVALAPCLADAVPVQRLWIDLTQQSRQPITGGNAVRPQSVLCVWTT